MAEKEPSAQWGWEALVRDCKWDAVENWWVDQYLQYPKNPIPLESLLSELRRIVPVISLVHGMEAANRYIVCNDAKDHWAGKEHLKGAAKILELGELQAATEGAPERASCLWNEYRRMLGEQLVELSSHPEEAVGGIELSRASHVQEASEHLNYIDNTTAWMCSEFDCEFDREWFREAAAEIAFAAFVAGRHTQEAWAKEFEHHAVTRLKSIRNFSLRNEGRTEYNYRRKRDRIDWEAHAMRVAETNKNLNRTKAALARYISSNWNKIGVDGQRPLAPSIKTMRNWLSTK